MSNLDKKSDPKVALIGAGDWGKNLLRNLHQLGVLAAICDLNPERVAVCKEQFPDHRYYTTYTQVLRDESTDAVVIATPSETHGTLVRAALEAGKDVLVEKPLCLSAREGEELIQLAEDKGKILMVG